ncbi:MAG: GNAT family N-acetyltransferase [Acidimicrobiia bacterium]|nr:GNAT family N-acetyltransferase [Acidimicrobiia bacterium]
MTVEFRAAIPADGAAILSLINLVQPHVPWTEAHFRWQYLEPPAGEAARFVAEDEGQIVSFYAAPRYDVSVVGEVREGWMVQDVMTHPDHRGRGYLHELGALCARHLAAAGALGFTFPNERSQGSFPRLGWTELGPVPSRLWPVRPGRAGSGVLTSVVEFPGDVGDIWRESGLAIGTRRDAAYLAWRYRKPGQTYRRFTVGDGAGFVVLKEFDAGGSRRLHVCDLVLRSTERSLLPGVLQDVQQAARDAGASELTAWLPPHHPYAAAFDAAGVVTVPTARRVFVTAPPADLARYAVMDRWHLTHGDSDVW